MTSLAARREALSAVPWLEDATPEALDALAPSAAVDELPAGAVLYRQGEPADELAVVLSGRLRASRIGDDGRPGVHREIGRGEPVGEIGALTGEPRAATVVAVRDSEVLRLGQEALDAALAVDPGLGRSLVRVVVERLRHPVLPAEAVGRVGLLASTPGADLAGTAAELADALGRLGHRPVVPGRGGVVDPTDPAALRMLIDRSEDEGEVVVLPLDGRAPWWDGAAARQVDTLLLVADAAARVELAPSARALLDELARDRVSPRRELLVVHPATAARPRDTTARLAAATPDTHHHVRAGRPADADRVARHLLGTSIGLVLSGGGARGMAHLGAYQALTEAGVAIDHVGGSSIGGVVAVQIATGARPEDLIALDRQGFQQADFGKRLTLPVVSLFSIRRALHLFDTLFGDLDLTDTWLPSFVTVVDFTTCTLEVVDRGPAATWARATASPPGLWPPVVGPDGHLVVDGGVLDNLPVGPMRRRGVGTVLAVNVSSRRDLAVADHDAAIRSWQDYLRRVASTRRAPTYPSLPAVMMRLGLVTSLGAQADAVTSADLCVDPDVAAYTMTNYRAFDDIVAAGYRATAEAIESGRFATA